ncbi:RagB/SusD family nutrient uptake outer membrane protein [Saccharicrinis sp. FJH62]|uniref:RagB/SusD family nutrient uptake outer membrane protein n=1 Tax=Saccharicrinis sp. FJH62 TaxID=3344657 RepID=UPI0035D4A4A9
MKTVIYISVLFLTALILSSCNDESFLEREPTDILSYEEVWKDKTLVLSVLSDLYDRIPEYQTIEYWAGYVDFDEAFGSSYSDYWRHKNNEYGYDYWSYWDYGLVREINLFLQNAKSDIASQLRPEDRQRFIAEGRFIRATIYFELVKRMGGVPLILEPLSYDLSGDPSSIQFPRTKESEIYDFVLNELDTIKSDLPDDIEIKGRATQGLILAMQSRVALYAASIAKYGVETPDVSLPGGEVGIPAEMAHGYYQKALGAAEKLLNEGPYYLYERKEDLSDNFASLFLDKVKNPEVIFVKDYQLQTSKVEGFTVSNQPWSVTEDLEGGRLNPSLNLVQSFEKLDNTFETFQTKDSDGNYIFYDRPEDIFADRDARLKGTVMVPGSTYKGKDLDIWAGYLLPNGKIITGDIYGARKILPGKSSAEQVVGFDGPIDGLEFTAQTGFYVRKYMDKTIGSGQRGVKSDVWWVRYRLGEVYLNAAEAAFELGDPDKAAQYLNRLRQRAGFTIPLTVSDVTFDRIVHERKVELAFEGHTLWDMKRWRLAHKVWNGEAVSLTDNPGKADEVSTRVYGLWPYRYYNPGDLNDGKYIYRQVLPGQVTGRDRFRLGNYYSLINDDIISSNPKLVRNPNQ